MKLYLRVNRAVWRRLPLAVRESSPLRWYGAILHGLVRRHAQRRQFFGTFFLRNRPELEQIRRLIAERGQCSTLRLAILGCSIGAEVYSVLWTIRRARPDLNVRTCAMDISPQVLAVAEKGIYTSDSCGLVGESIFERLSEAELREMFDWDRDIAGVKEWLRKGIEWHLGDAGDPRLIRALGPQDIVLASNFLCHMTPEAAESCLRNIAHLLEPRGYLLVLGVDLDVREKVARELGWRPVVDLIREIHDGDPVLRRDWPWQWWGLEPFNNNRRDWQLRYAATFQLGSGPGERTEQNPQAPCVVEKKS